MSDINYFTEDWQKIYAQVGSGAVLAIAGYFIGRLQNYWARRARYKRAKDAAETLFALVEVAIIRLEELIKSDNLKITLLEAHVSPIKKYIDSHLGLIIEELDSNAIQGYFELSSVITILDKLCISEANSHLGGQAQVNIQSRWREAASLANLLFSAYVMTRKNGTLVKAHNFLMDPLGFKRAQNPPKVTASIYFGAEGTAKLKEYYARKARRAFLNPREWIRRRKGN